MPSENSVIARFNRRVPLALRLVVVLFFGVVIYISFQSSLAAAVKLSTGTDCPWPRTVTYGYDLIRMAASYSFSSARVKLIAEDPKLGIQQFSTGGRNFWIQKKGSDKNGEELLAYLLAEHRWMAASSGSRHVKQGD